MGRGGNPTEALEAKQLLYGRRRSPLLSPERVKKQKQEQRYHRRQATKSAYIAQFDQARECLNNGQGQALIELLKEPAGHGLKKIEKEELRKTIAAAADNYDYISDRDYGQAEILGGASDLASLVALYQRVKERGLAQRQVDAALSMVHNHAHLMANYQIFNQLDQDKDKIGPLPLVGYGNDYNDHLVRTDGQLVCGRKVIDPQMGTTFTKEKSPIDRGVDCQNCITLYQDDPDSCAYLSPDQWSQLLQDGDLDYHGYPNNSDLGKSSGSDEQRAAQVLESNRQRSLREINNYLTPFSDYRLS